MSFCVQQNKEYTIKTTWGFLGELSLNRDMQCHLFIQSFWINTRPLHYQHYACSTGRARGTPLCSSFCSSFLCFLDSRSVSCQPVCTTFFHCKEENRCKDVIISQMSPNSKEQIGDITLLLRFWKGFSGKQMAYSHSVHLQEVVERTFCSFFNKKLTC